MGWGVLVSVVERDMGWFVLVSVVERYMGWGVLVSVVERYMGVRCPGKRCGALHGGDVSW